MALDNNVQKESNKRLGTTATIVPEFSSSSRYFGSEFGNAPAGPIHLAASKNVPGPHGQLYWTHGNSIFSARSFFQVGGVQPARDNQYGAKFTTGIWKNAFVSMDAWQSKNHGFVNGNILVPRLEERSCLATEAAACALIDRWMRAFPAAAPNRLDIDPRALNTNAAQAIDTDAASARLDQTLGGKHRLTARYAWTNQQVDAFQLVDGQNPDTTTKSHDARLSASSSLNPRTVLDVTAGFSRARALLVPEPNAVGPQVQIGTALEKLGPGSGIPVDRVQNRYQVAARLARQDGRHFWSAGYELGRLHFNGSEASSNRGNVYFRNDFGVDAITNFRRGVISRYSYAQGDIARGFRRWEQFAFVQDAWRVTSRLSLQMGLRYQPFQGIREVNNLTVVPFEGDWNNLAPNFGFAFRGPKNIGVFRGAYSVQYGEIFPATLQQLRWNPPNFQKIEVQNPPFLNLTGNIQFGPDARAIVFDVPANLRTPYSHQYNFSWELPIPRAAGTLQAGYVGTRTWKLFYMVYANRAVPVPGIAQTTSTINDRRPDPRYFDYRPITNGSRAYFDAGRVTYTVPAWRGVTVDTSYWWSKAIDTGASYVSVAAGDEANQGQAQSLRNISADLRGPSAFDQAHAAIVRFSYGTGTRPLHGPAVITNALANWRLGGILLAKSGAPFAVISGSDAPGYGNVDGVIGDRPNLLDTSVLGREMNHPDTSRQLLPRSAFGLIRPTDDRGNLGMNTFRRGGIRNLNASLERRWSLPSERGVSFRAEAINALNTPQFAEPVFDLSNPAFGMITNTLNDGRAFKFSFSLEF